MNAWALFRTGLSHALRYRRLVGLLFLVNLLSALALTALPAAGLAGAPARGLAIHDAADGIDAWLALETLLSPLTQLNLEESEALPSNGWGAVLGLLSLAALFAPALAFISKALLSGGVLLTYAEAPQPFRWRRFLWGCWRWFGAFLLLGVMQGGVLLVLAPLTLIALMVAGSAGAWLTWPLVVLLAAVILFWMMAVELTRAQAVVTGTRNVFRALGAALRVIFARPLALLGIYALALLLLAAVYALFWGLAALLPAGWWLLLLLVQQGFVVVQLWARLARWAAGVAVLLAKN